jgi:enoyl-CoA hydratase
MNMELVESVRRKFQEIAADASCRVIILTGAGRGFCSGLDLRDEGEQPGSKAHSTVQAAARIQEAYASIITTMRSVPQIVIAAINGPAIGGGFAMTLGADIRIAAESAKFSIAMIRIGLTAGDMGISYHLPRYVGASRAFELMLTGRTFDVREAERIGLISKVVKDGQAVEASLEFADLILQNSPLGVRLTKQVMWSALDSSFLSVIELENRGQALALQTKDSVEAVKAYFTEKRRPVYLDE